METGTIGMSITVPTSPFAATPVSNSGTATGITPAAVACITDGGAPALLATSRRSRKASLGRPWCDDAPVCTEDLNSDVVVMEAAEEWM